MCAGVFLENERRGHGALSMPDVRQELPTKTSLAATHERRVHWNTAAISLRNVPFEIPPKISSRASSELETWNHNATHAPANQVGKVA